ncbi:response regulator transcription factor [Paenibacillus filicis]|uniref:Response regulator transcription factor n=1 Tax=Paenibacillus filicis TaxID=669464 RepID=A0ABU9DRS0_9BACL
MRTILIVEDEPKIREVVVSYMQHAGYRTLEAETGGEALALLKEAAVDFVILDLMLPDVPGEEVCRQIRQISPVPVLMLTAKSSAQAKVQGLTLGADDYVVKPFEPAELVARVRAIWRRSGPEAQLLSEKVSFREGELVIDAAAGKVVVRGTEASLTTSEYKLLLALARHPGRTWSRDDLIVKAFGYDYDGDARTIDQHIKNMRHKLEPDPKRPVWIETVFGSGYRFNGG